MKKRTRKNKLNCKDRARFSISPSFVSTILLIVFALLPLTAIAAGVTRILPLGDSITQGGNYHPSYRRALWNLLQNAGHSVDFVGSHSVFHGTVPSNLQDFDLDHEGHWAWEAGQLDGSLQSWLTGYDADIVLIHAGTNDVDRGQSYSSTLDELASIINKLRADNPVVSILLAKIIPMQGVDTSAFNSALEAWASTQSTQQSRVIIVDQYSDYNAATDNYDKWHPNSVGEQKMATRWFEALEPLLLEHETTSAPLVDPDSGTYHSRVGVSLSAVEEDASIYYTIDGSVPTGDSSLYSGPFKLDSSATVNALAVSPGGQPSAVTTATYTVLNQPVWSPAPALDWQWQLQGEIDTGLNVDMYDIDLFDSPQAIIDQLHTDGKKVVCYFSAGSWEDWRDDAGAFPESVKGSDLSGWEGEKWLDIRNLDVLKPIMRARMQIAVAKGCDGIEPDNVDAYTNASGFPLSADDQLNYNLWLANEANSLGLSIGLKNDLDQIVTLEPFFDWALNEQCFQYEECDLLTPFIASNKAVFGVEYNLELSQFCESAIAMQFSWLKKNFDLGVYREACEESNELPSFQLADNSWQMLSIPADPGATNTVADLFGDELPAAEYGRTWAVFTYQPGGSYIDVGLSGLLSPGQGFWMIQRTGESVELKLPAASTQPPVVQSPACSSATGCFELSVESGNETLWNLLGNPFSAAISFDELRARSMSGVCLSGCTLDEAATANYLHNRMWVYSGAGGYTLVESGGAIPAWNGAWSASLPDSNSRELRLLVPTN